MDDTLMIIVLRFEGAFGSANRGTCLSCVGEVVPEPGAGGGGGAGGTTLAGRPAFIAPFCCSDNEMDETHYQLTINSRARNSFQKNFKIEFRKNCGRNLNTEVRIKVQYIYS